MPPATSTASRKRTRSTNLSENNNDHESTTSTSTIVSSLPTNTAPPKRRRNNPPSVESHTNYSLRNRSATPETHRYNLRPRRPPLQVPLPHVSTSLPRRTPHQISSSIPTIAQQEQPTTSAIPPRQYRLVYISDDDDDHHQPTTATQPSTTTFNLITDNNDIEPIPSRRTARSTSNNTRSRIVTDPTNTTTIDTSDFPNGGVSNIRFNRAIEIVIDSIQSLEGAVNNFDQLVFSLIYGRFSTRTEYESIEGMIRLSRILNLNFPARLTQDEIDALPRIKFHNKSESTTSILLAEKCPICMTEFTDQEIINKLHCTHLFHLQCISTWLGENDSCPTCRRKVNGD